MLRAHLLSAPVYEKLRREFDQALLALGDEISEIYSKDSGRTRAELEEARNRLVAAERSSIEEAVRDGLISVQTGTKTADAVDSQMDQLIERILKAAR